MLVNASFLQTQTLPCRGGTPLCGVHGQHISKALSKVENEGVGSVENQAGFEIDLFTNAEDGWVKLRSGVIRTKARGKGKVMFPWDRTEEFLVDLYA